jgi:hypothetical protein
MLTTPMLTTPMLTTPMLTTPMLTTSAPALTTIGSLVRHLLPRPRPAELASPPVASKEKTPTPIQIND